MKNITEYKDGRSERQLAAEENSRNVMLLKINWEINKRGVAEADRPTFIKDMVFQYTDALRRGFTLVENKLRDGQRFETPVMSGEGIMTYRMEEGKLKKRILSQSRDPAHIVSFRQAARERGINTQETEVDFWTEGFLISQAIDEGLKEQERQYQSFISAALEVRSAQEQYGTILSYLGSPQDNFSKILGIEADLQIGIKEKPYLTAKDIFTLRDFTGGGGLADFYSKARQEISEIAKLNDFFSDSKGNRDTQRERAMAVKLLTDNPEKWEKSTLINPKVSIEEIEKANDFIIGVSGVFGPEGKKAAILYLVDYLILGGNININPDSETKGSEVLQNLQGSKRLQELFGVMGLPKELGLEFLRNLLVETLQKMPDEVFKETARGSAERERRISEIFLQYGINGDDRQERYQRKTAEADFWVEDFFKTVQEDREMTKRQFEQIHVRGWGDFLREILAENGAFYNDPRYEKAVSALFKLLHLEARTNRKENNIMVNLQQHNIFYSHLYSHPDKAKTGLWVEEMRDGLEFFQVMAAEISGGNEKLLLLTEDLVFRNKAKFWKDNFTKGITDIGSIPGRLRKTIKEIDYTSRRILYLRSRIAKAEENNFLDRDKKDLDEQNTNLKRYSREFAELSVGYPVWFCSNKTRLSERESTNQYFTYENTKPIYEARSAELLGILDYLVENEARQVPEDGSTESFEKGQPESYQADLRLRIENLRESYNKIVISQLWPFGEREKRIEYLTGLFNEAVKSCKSRLPNEV